ncbi:MAG: hypothetical protein AAGI72_05235 [Pseudomonadota bacterium]
MAETEVSRVTMTVTTVEVFVAVMKFIEEHQLWEDAECHLRDNGKTHMFFDHEVLDLFREMLRNRSDIDQEHPLVVTILRHL